MLRCRRGDYQRNSSGAGAAASTSIGTRELLPAAHFRVAPVFALLLFFLGAHYSRLQAQTSEECLACHSDPALEMQKRGRTVSLLVNSQDLKSSVHASLSCVDCHGALNPTEIPHAAAIPQVQCGNCHDASNYEKSVHGSSKTGRAATCKNCHGTHKVLAPGDPGSMANRTHISSTCGTCHKAEDEHYSRSAHGIALKQGIQGAPACIDCHGEHNVERISSADSPVYKTHEASVCLHCHLDNPDVRKRVGPSAGFIAEYSSSVHGVALAAGNVNAATCSDCHGAHDMKKGSDPTSKVSKWNTVETCSQCHAAIAAIFSESIHGKALARRNQDAPTCTDCHGEHQIYAHLDTRSRVAAQNVATEVCAKCHSSVQLSLKYGIPPERFKTFEDSFHGLASRAGSVEVANCASCHGVHNIKPSSDPTSTINKANLASTCGRCHPGANENFAKGPVHVIVAPNGSAAILYWIAVIYIGIIAVTIGGMFLHNLLDFISRSRRRLAIRQGKLQANHHSNVLYERMTLNQRIQHVLLFSSFIVLVITGFMLRFPDAWWVAPIRRVSERFFEVRSITHRVAGVVMIVVSLYHLFYLFLAKQGRRLVLDLLPKLQDARDVWRLIKYNVGITKTKPLFDRFSYIEKSEYWALVWGTIIMAGTGIIMWFDNYFISLLTKLGWDIARTIHYYEAWLATLAIIVWHFYAVIFNPDVYPMSTAWLTGKLSEEEMTEEHPLELERLRSQQLEGNDQAFETLPDPAAGHPTIPVRSKR